MIRQFIKTRVRYVLKKLEWKRRFPGRTTVGKYSFGFDNIAVGTGTYGEISVLTSDPNPSLTLGRYCSIAREVVFVTGNEHPMDRLSTYPFRVLTLGRKGCEATSKGGIVVEDDVWIGFRATILDGVKIGQGGGCRCRFSGHQGGAALHGRRGSPREGHREEVRRGHDQPPRCLRLREGRPRLRRAQRGPALRSSGCLRSWEAAR